MKLHGWYLPLLAEAFPQQKNLYGTPAISPVVSAGPERLKAFLPLTGYNVNGGKEIHLRLRPPFDDKSFLPLEDSLIPTMLHELTHNHRGPHDEIFFSFLEKLTDELAAYQKHGFFGFAGRGQRLGAGLRAPLGGEDVRAARIKHLQRVERMRKLLEKGGRLGGEGPKRITSATIATVSTCSSLALWDSPEHTDAEARAFRQLRIDAAPLSAAAETTLTQAGQTASTRNRKSLPTWTARRKTAS